MNTDIANHDGKSLRELAELLRRHRNALALFIVSAMASSLILTFVFSERYHAATLLVYRPTDSVDVQPNAIVPDKTTLGFPVPSSPLEAVGATIERIGKSERVLRRVVTDLGLDQPSVNTRTGFAWFFSELKSTGKKWLRNVWQILKFGRVIHEDPTTEAIIGLMKYTTIDSQKDFTTTIVVVDKDPERAAAIVDDLAKVLVEEVKAISVEVAQERSAELANRLNEKSKSLDEIHAQIEQIKSEWGFHSLSEEMQLHLNSLETFEANLLKNELQLSDARAKLVSLEAQRTEMSTTLPSSETVQDDPLFGELQRLRAQLVVERDGMLQRRGPKHSEIRALTEKITNIETQLTELEAQRITNAVTSTNPTYQSILRQEVATRSELEGLLAANASLNQSIRHLRERILSPQIVSKMDALELQLTAQQADYLHLSAALEEARTAELANAPEIRILFPATPIREPIRPIRVYHVALTGVLALALGIALIFLMDFLSSQWNAPFDLLSTPGRATRDPGAI